MSIEASARYADSSWHVLEIEARHDRALAEQELAAILRERDAMPHQHVTRAPRINYAAEPIYRWPVDMQNALHGKEPAEALPTEQRHALVRVLHRRGWTDAEVAERLQMTLYTAARIRQHLRLPANLTTQIEWRAVA
jgi:transcriptional regulator with GAF, ATPase, and Fis domain